MILGSADNVIKHDARVFEVNHVPRFFVDYLRNALPYAGFTTAVDQHLRVERHATIPVVYVERADDLFLRFDPYHVARTKPELRFWGLVQSALDERKPPPASDRQELWKPSPA
jgi:hypothetical protein